MGVHFQTDTWYLSTTSKYTVLKTRQGFADAQFPNILKLCFIWMDYCKKHDSYFIRIIILKLSFVCVEYTWIVQNYNFWDIFAQCCCGACADFCTIHWFSKITNWLYLNILLYNVLTVLVQNCKFYCIVCVMLAIWHCWTVCKFQPYYLLYFCMDEPGAKS